MKLSSTTPVFSDLWKNYLAMKNGTTSLDKITEREVSDRKSYNQQCLTEATNKAYINAKKLKEGDFLERLEDAKKENQRQTTESMKQFRAFIGKGTKIDRYV